MSNGSAKVEDIGANSYPIDLLVAPFIVNDMQEFFVVASGRDIRVRIQGVIQSIAYNLELKLCKYGFLGWSSQDTNLEHSRSL